jgi:lipopolysaccharide export system protein LptA
MILMMRRFPHGIAIAAFLLALFAVNSASAQGSMSGVPNAMQGFSQNRDQPIQIEAAALEMRDKKKEATFSGRARAARPQGCRRHGHCADAIGDPGPRRGILDQAA